MVMEVHELDRLQKGGSVYLEVTVGRMQMATRGTS